MHLRNSFCQNSFSIASWLVSLLQLNEELRVSVFWDLKPECSVEREQKILKYIHKIKKIKSSKPLKSHLTQLIYSAMQKQTTIIQYYTPTLYKFISDFLCFQPMYFNIPVYRTTELFFSNYIISNLVWNQFLYCPHHLNFEYLKTFLGLLENRIIFSGHDKGRFPSLDVCCVWHIETHNSASLYHSK